MTLWLTLLVIWVVGIPAAVFIAAALGCLIQDCRAGAPARDSRRVRRQCERRRRPAVRAALTSTARPRR